MQREVPVGGATNCYYLSALLTVRGVSFKCQIVLYPQGSYSWSDIFLRYNANRAKELTIERRHRTRTADTAYFVGWPNEEYYDISPQHCSQAFVIGPSWWHDYEESRLLYVFTARRSRSKQPGCLRHCCLSKSMSTQCQAKWSFICRTMYPAAV